MFVERDTEFNAAYISFRDKVEKGVVARTVEAVPGVYLKLDSNEKLVGIEILSTIEVIGVPAAEVEFFRAGELLGVKEAARLTGKNRANFLRDLASRPDFPKPIARLASGQVWLSRDIERYLEEQESARSSGPSSWLQEHQSTSENLGDQASYSADEQYEDVGYEEEGTEFPESDTNYAFYPNEEGYEDEEYEDEVNTAVQQENAQFGLLGRGPRGTLKVA